MPIDCPKSLQFCAVRFALLEDNGVPSPGAGNLHVIDDMGELTFTVVNRDGQEFESVTGCGELSLSAEEEETIKRLDLTLAFQAQHPSLQAMITGGTSIGDEGFALASVGEKVDRYVSTEVWTRRVDNGGFDIGDGFPYWRWVLPRTRWRVDQRSFGNSHLIPSFSGKGFENSNWFDGPLNDWPYTSSQLYQYHRATTIPTASCDAVELAAS